MLRIEEEMLLCAVPGEKNYNKAHVTVMHTFMVFMLPTHYLQQILQWQEHGGTYRHMWGATKERTFWNMSCQEKPRLPPSLSPILIFLAKDFFLLQPPFLFWGDGDKDAEEIQAAPLQGRIPYILNSYFLK